MGLLFDYGSGDFVMPVSNNMGLKSNGDMIMRTSNNTAIDMRSGDLHITSSWNDNNPWDDDWDF